MVGVALVVYTEVLPGFSFISHLLVHVHVLLLVESALVHGALLGEVDKLTKHETIGTRVEDGHALDVHGHPVSKVRILSEAIVEVKGEGVLLVLTESVRGTASSFDIEHLGGLLNHLPEGSFSLAVPKGGEGGKS